MNIRLLTLRYTTITQYNEHMFDTISKSAKISTKQFIPARVKDPAACRGAFD